jgi:hypothetical protein
VKTLAKRLSKLEVMYSSQRNQQGLTPADVLRQRTCRREAEETGWPYEELLHERVIEAEAFWKRYDGDGSIADILRFRYKERAA